MSGVLKKSDKEHAMPTQLEYGIELYESGKYEEAFDVCCCCWHDKEM